MNNSAGRAKQLRRRMSVPERILWKHLRLGDIGGRKIRRQHPIGPYVADFYCHEARMVIEVDGTDAHSRDRVAHDRRRNAWMKEMGYAIVRLSAADVTRDVGWVTGYLRRRIEERVVAFHGGGDPLNSVASPDAPPSAASKTRGTSPAGGGGGGSVSHQLAQDERF